MKIKTPIGSKERFLEMFQGVNKVQLNEVNTNVVQTGTQLIEKAFEELKNKQANIQQTNTQTVGDNNFVEIISNDEEGNVITFKFKIDSAEGDQDGVYNVSNAVLSEFKVQSQTLNVDMPENMEAVQDFNANHGGEIMDVVSEYANFETETASLGDEVYEEAVRFIDKVPYKKGTEQMQTNKAYADQKPTNPDVRVKSDELDKFVSEMDEYEPEAEEDPMALPPEFTDADIPDDDDDTKGIDPFDQEIMDYENDDEPLEQVSPEKAAVINQAYDNLVNAGNQAPTTNEIMAEIDRLQGKVKPVEKTRAIPKGAEAFWESKHKVIDMNADTATQHLYNKTVSPEMKEKVIRFADEILGERLGVRKFQMPREEYLEMVRKLAIEIYRQDAIEMNETEEKKISKDYPDQMGKKFKPKNQIPKKKKRPQSVVKLSEESEIPQEYWGNPEDEINEEDVEKEKEEVGDMIAGGKADKKKPQDFDKEQIKMGLKVEMEHTDDPMVAIEITMDHLTEFPDYYTRLDKMEKQAKGDTKSESEEPHESGAYLQDGMPGEKDRNGHPIPSVDPNFTMMKPMEGMVDNTPEEEEITDELLGYKPHNVGDYASEEFDHVPSADAEKQYWDKEHYKQDQEKEVGGEEEKEEIIDEEDGMEEYTGEVGDRYQDGEGNQFTVRDMVKGGVTLQGQGGDKEIATRDIQFLKKLSEEVNKHIVVYDGTSAYVENENNIPEDVEVIGRFNNIDDAQAFADKYNDSAYAITEEQVKTARQALNRRGITDGMTKKEAVQLLIKHNIK